METNHKSVLTYRFNKTLMAEIESLTQKIQTQLKASKMTEHHLSNYLRSLSRNYGIYKRSVLEVSNFDDLNLKQMLRVLIRKQYAFEHGKAISRGKAYAKAQRLVKQTAN
jgi:hypothetical protein